MLLLLRRLNQRVLSLERRALVGLLVSLVLVAGVQAIVRNLGRMDVAWAKQALWHLLWVDPFLSKCTMTIVFLGASVAADADRHTSIDLLASLVSERSRQIMRAASRTFAGLSTLALAYAFSQTVGLLLTEYPIDLTVMGEHGPIHVCDGTPAQLAAVRRLERPMILCAFRSLLAAVGIEAQTIGAAVQTLIPCLLVVMGLRMLAKGVDAARSLMR